MLMTFASDSLDMKNIHSERKSSDDIFSMLYCYNLQLNG